jgi:hypothetical protein
MRVRALPRSRLPRAFRSHAGHQGHAYRTFAAALVARLRLDLPLSPDAAVLVREAGRLAVELERLGDDLERARARHRQRDAARIRRQAFMAREQLGRLEDRLAALAAHGNGQRDPLADVRHAVEEANRR